MRQVQVETPLLFSSPAKAFSVIIRIFLHFPVRAGA